MSRYMRLSGVNLANDGPLGMLVLQLPLVRADLTNNLDIPG